MRYGGDINTARKRNLACPLLLILVTCQVKDMSE